jgi:hypothetical protein
MVYSGILDDISDNTDRAETTVMIHEVKKGTKQVDHEM